MQSLDPNVFIRRTKLEVRSCMFVKRSYHPWYVLLIIIIIIILLCW